MKIEFLAFRPYIEEAATREVGKSRGGLLGSYGVFYLSNHHHDLIWVLQVSFDVGQVSIPTPKYCLIYVHFLSYSFAFECWSSHFAGIVGKIMSL